MLASCTILASSASAAFDLKKLSTYSTEGDAGIYYRYDKPGTGLVRISPWHDIPFTLGKDEQGVPLLSFVCEIPRGTREKFEIHKSVSHNPLLQDVHKNGTLREYVYSPAIVNYGAITQTWEDPEEPDEDTTFGGDNDPIDVLQLNEGSCTRGAVQRVRVLGGLALVDDGETDWKLTLTLTLSLSLTPNPNQVAGRVAWVPDGWVSERRAPSEGGARLAAHFVGDALGAEAAFA